MEGVEIKLSCLKHHLQTLSNGQIQENGVWRVIGQEQDGCLLIRWSSLIASHEPATIIGLFDVTSTSNQFQVLYKFSCVKNVIQASINATKSVLVFVTKEKDVVNCNESENYAWYYKVFLTKINSNEIKPIDCNKTRQTMVQFLYRKKGCSRDRFLVLTHQDSIQLYQLEEIKPVDEEDKCVDQENNTDAVLIETIVRAFCWAQWDAIHQSLYFIHYRKPPPVPVEGEVQDDETELAPTLSALQFHDDMPHETVLNTPLNLPGMVGEESLIEEGLYEDVPVPLRVHDGLLDVTVVSDSKGILCICHYYLYQPVQPPASDMLCDSQTVHFAYSVTLLHHGQVVHCVMPGVPFSQASTLRPTFTMQGDQHLLVYTPGLFVHLLDIGPNHEPCCHIALSSMSDVAPLSSSSSSRLVKLLSNSSFYSEQSSINNLLLNMTTMDVITLHVTSEHLVKAFKCEDAILENKLSILHYFLIHVGDTNLLTELLIPLAKNCTDLNLPKLMQEVLVGSAYASTLRGLPTDAVPLLDLLPLTTVSPSTTMQIKVSPTTRLSMSLRQEDLWNPSVMLLSPRQRLMPYRADMWTALWDVLSAPKESRFRPATVAEKLMVSLVCYQPEALSRCSTPLSPGGPLMGSGGTLSDLAMITGNRAKQITDPLPFYEVESSAASKQEHVISVNLREVSMHLLKRSKGITSPMQVHAVATRYAAAQLESSYHLCHIVTKSSAVDTVHQERGFPLVDGLEEGKRRVLFALMERYNLAVEMLAFPLPQGFPSFMAYLGYRTLPFPMFLQYVQASVLQLQVDVMKAIMADLPDTGEGLTKKLRLLQILPRSRGKRLMNQWSHPASLMIRAREHALNILSGVEGAHARGHPHRLRNQSINRGLAAFPSADRLSPLDTFLDLLTAKASLAELDFTLLIEATMASTEDFID
ncbi:gamma-secretase activating protein pigeon [Lycorma delicatula]|uniref:gamma-secretase activating protein pigeon n=1 Tax=Lycorma delicatula TaxID=130591 RepID=UPI003F51AADD